MKKTLVINLMGGPGCGKSTAAAAIFTELKRRDISCELVTEYAKDKVWEQSFRVLSNQIYVFAKQLHRLRRLDGQVDVIVTDTSLLFSFLYGEESDEFYQLVLKTFDEFDNMNILLERMYAYQEKGRMQTEEESHGLDTKIESIMIEKDIDYQRFAASRKNIEDELIPAIIEKIK